MPRQTRQETVSTHFNVYIPIQSVCLCGCVCGCVCVFDPAGDANTKPAPDIEELRKSEEEATDSLYQHALDGFVMVITEDGDLVFLSDSVDKHLGINQVS